MVALLHLSLLGTVLAGASSAGGVVAQSDFGDWGRFIVMAAFVLVAGLNGLLKAAKEKREARKRELQMPPPKSSRTPSSEKPARARPATFQRETARPRQPIPLQPKPQSRSRPQTPPPAPVSESPPTANVPPIFEKLADAIREASKELPRRAEKSRRPAAKREPARPVPSAKKLTKPARQAVSARHFITEHEQEHADSMDKRLGHVAKGIVAPVADAYAKKKLSKSVVHGVDLRKAIILNEILGPPVAMRDTDDYFNP